MPLLRDVNGFSQLLELFPLVTAIKATHAHLVMPSRDSAGQRPTTAEATLYVTVSLNQAHTGPAWQCHVVDLRFLPHCEVIYDVDLDNDDIDYSTALWDECLLSFPGSTNTVSAAPTPVWIDEESGIKISLHAILRRSIRSLVCRESATLLVLADHMRCRKRLGFTDLERIAVIDNTSDGGYNNLPAAISKLDPLLTPRLGQGMERTPSLLQISHDAPTHGLDQARQRSDHGSASSGDGHRSLVW
jgi:hypothetical protein